MGLGVILFAVLFVHCLPPSFASSSATSRKGVLEFDIIHSGSEGSPIKHIWKSELEKLETYLNGSFQRYHQLSQNINRRISASMTKKVSLKASSRATSLENQIGNLVYTFGGYILPFSIGTPSVTQFLLFDPANTVSWVQANECTICYKQMSASFKITESSSADVVSCSSSTCKTREVDTKCSKTKECTFTENYLVGTSVSGSIITDTFRMKKLNVKDDFFQPKIIFGYALETRKLTTFVDGVAAFGRGIFSLPSQFATTLGRNAFSTCLVRDELSAVGKLIMGPEAINPSGVSYTPILDYPFASNVPYYYVQVTNIFVAKKRAKVPPSAWKFSKNNPNGGTIIDPGMVYTFLTDAAFNPVVYMLKNFLKSRKVKLAADMNGLSPCYALTLTNVTDAANYFPQITFTFSGGATLDLLGYHYVATLAEGVVCSVLQPAGNNFNIIGGYSLYNFLTVYDVSRQRIGFKPMNCATDRPR